jgi:glycosyltransferase involved in cell wall biosynthesis
MSRSSGRGGPDVVAASTRTSASLAGIEVLLMSSGHEVTDHRLYAKQALSLHRLGATVKLVGRLRTPQSTGDIPVIVVPSPSSRLVRFLWQPWRCLWAARHEDPHVVHFHDAEMLMILPVARGWWPRSRFVYDVHEDFANLIAIRDWLPSAVKRPVRMLVGIAEKSLAMFAHAIVGVTAPLADKFWNRRRAVAHNYVSRDFFERATVVSREPRAREYDVVHLGTLSRARAQFLADVLRELDAMKPNTRSLVIGVSPDIELLLRPVVPPGCTLVGPTPYDKVPAMLGNARVGINVHPALHPHLVVALPVKVCEYMAAGCGVVSSALPVLDHALSSAGIDSRHMTVISGGRPREYAVALASWLDAIAVGDDPGAELKTRAMASLTWEAEADGIARLYLGLLGRPCDV